MDLKIAVVSILMVTLISINILVDLEQKKIKINLP